MSVCLFILLVVCGPFSILVFIFNSFNNLDMITITITITITSVRVQRCDAFMPQTGVQRTRVGSSQDCVSIRPFICLSVCRLSRVNFT